jgi:hypothetical protein
MEIGDFGGKVGVSLVALAEAIELACVGVRSSVERLAVVIRHATARVATGLRLFVEASYLDMAAKAYLRTHRRLPGSERTARLRKKRRVMLLRWFLRYVKGWFRCRG